MRRHPEYRPIVVAATLALLLVLGVIAWAAISDRPHGEAELAQSTRSTPRVVRGAGGPGPTAAATTSPEAATAVVVGERFSLAYVQYDYRQGPPNGDAVEPYATNRLYWQITQGGQDTSGNPAPWTAITQGADDVVTASVVSARAQVADANDIAVQVVLREHDANTGGSWSGEVQEDLGLVLSDGQWLTDQVSQVDMGSGT